MKRKKDIRKAALRKSVAAVLLAATMLFGGVTVFADDFLPPEPFEIWSEDETTVFRWNPDTGTLGQILGEGAVYRDGELVYSVEGIPSIGESRYSFHFFDDFRFLVFIPRVSQVAALGFFENGELLRAYRIDELVRDMREVSYSVQTALWARYDDDGNESVTFDTENNTLTIVTVDGITYVFDITTGEIIYDTAGDAPFVPTESSPGSTMPRWAQNPRYPAPPPSPSPPPLPSPSPYTGSPEGQPPDEPDEPDPSSSIWRNPLIWTLIPAAAIIALILILRLRASKRGKP